jgi:AraC-like ligand binding domain./Bacterial regulatory helix-turn-helix proteins, AraC family.
MIIEGLHEKKLFEPRFPFRLLINHEQNFTYPAHWHNACELIYVVKNSFSVIVNSQTYNLNEGDILFIPGGQIHEFCDEPPTGKRVFINFELIQFNSLGMNSLDQSLLSDIQKITPESSAVYDNVKEEILKIVSEHNSETEMSKLYYTARLMDIIFMLCKNSNLNKTKASGKDKILAFEKIRKSIDFIHNHYNENIRLKDAANAAGYSECYFSRFFKEVTEVSFHQYLNEYRVKKAEYLLTSCGYSISETAYAAGFGSVASFERIFRCVKGCSPTEFRKLQN